MNSNPVPETRAEPGHAAFPVTLWTVVLQARSEDPARAADALHRLCVQYERAIHAWFQRSRPPWIPAGRAEEWAQDFFVFIHEKNPFRKVEQRDSRFRSFLVTCLKNFLKDKLDVELAAKRGGGAERVPIEDAKIAADSPDDELFAVHDALAKLTGQDALAGEIVSLRYFAGLKWEEIAELTGISERDLQRQWHFARTWLHAEISAMRG